MSIKPSEYVLGTQPPILKTDPGAGAWNSTPSSLGMKALKELLAAAPTQSLASHFGGDDAVKHLMHYLGNSGGSYSIDLDGMIKEVPIAKQAFDAQVEAAKKFVESLPPGRHNFTSKTGSLNHYITQSMSRNWFFAVASYTSWGRGVATVQSVGGKLQFTIDYEYNFFDRYNWDGKKQVQIPIPGYDKLPGPAKALIDKLPNVAGGRLTVTDKSMGEFHRQGLAKEFDMVAKIKRTVTWRLAAPFALYKVQSGDTLSLIAKRYYGDANKWPVIHNANKVAVHNPNIIRAGQELKIPQ